MTTGGGVFKVTAEAGAWAWGGGTDEPWRYIPAGNGMGTFLQGIGWPLVYITAGARDEAVENFGRGADFV